MIGIILAGGMGSRLYPLTQDLSKQLLPVFDKPMIYYPITTMMFAGVRTLFIIVTPDSLPLFKSVLGDGSQWGIKIIMIVQREPKGIADCFNLIPTEFTTMSCVVCLGDNIFYGSGLGSSLKTAFDGSGALAYAYEVSNPEKYGVVKLESNGSIVEIVEKPSQYLSSYAIPGLYWFDANCFDYVKQIKPSKRGELEITDILKMYLVEQKLKIKILQRGTAWLDTGTAASLLAASVFVSVIEERQGLKIGCPEEVALREKLIDKNKFNLVVSKLPEGPYKTYLEKFGLEN